MTKTTKKIVLWTAVILGIGFIGYVGFVIYELNSFVSGCGMNDGPFNAALIDPIVLSEHSEKHALTKNTTLVIDNRTDTLSPVLTLKENETVIWALDMDTRNTKGYETTLIWKISSITIT